MLINSLEKMEEIVQNNRSLRWDGWTVTNSYPSPTAWMQPEGVFIKGKWFIQKRYEPTASGWEIPNKFVR